MVERLVAAFRKHLDEVELEPAWMRETRTHAVAIPLGHTTALDVAGEAGPVPLLPTSTS